MAHDRLIIMIYLIKNLPKSLTPTVTWLKYRWYGVNIYPMYQSWILNSRFWVQTGLTLKYRLEQWHFKAISISFVISLAYANERNNSHETYTIRNRSIKYIHLSRLIVLPRLLKNKEETHTIYMSISMNLWLHFFP